MACWDAHTFTLTHSLTAGARDQTTDLAASRCPAPSPELQPNVTSMQKKKKKCKKSRMVQVLFHSAAQIKLPLRDPT